MSAMAVVPVVEIETKAMDISTRAAAVTVTDQPSYEAAGEMLTGIKALRNEAEAHHRPIIESAHRTHKLACDALNKVDRPLLAAEQFIKQRIGRYLTEQARKEREAERVARDLAEKQRQEEALAIAVQAEQEGASEIEVAAVLEEAAAAPLVQPMPPPTPAPVAVKGVSSRVTYRVEVSDARKLLAAVIAPDSPHAGLLVNGEAFVGVSISAMNRVAQAQGGKLVIPGVNVIENRGVAVRA